MAKNDLVVVADMPPSGSMRMPADELVKMDDGALGVYLDGRLDTTVEPDDVERVEPAKSGSGFNLGL